jgi:hypothetical protein
MARRGDGIDLRGRTRKAAILVVWLAATVAAFWWFVP